MCTSFLYSLSPVLFCINYFYFRIVLDLQKSCEDFTKFQYPSHAFSPIIKHFALVYLSQLRSQCWHIIINWNPYFILISLVFAYVLVSSLRGFHPKYHIIFSHHLLGLFLLLTVPQISLFSITLTVFVVFWHYRILQGHLF